jgi:hypothetical protein
VAVEDVLTIFPPTRQYTNAEVRRELKDRGIDGVLVVNVADTGVMSQYAGTILSGGYNGTVSGYGTVNNFGGTSTVSYGGVSTGSYTGSATPIYRQSRQTTFSAKLVEPTTGRNLWVGNGQINASGRLFVGADTSASRAAGAIFADWKPRGSSGLKGDRPAPFRLRMETAMRIIFVVAAALVITSTISLAAHNQNIRRCKWYYDYVRKVNIQNTHDNCDRNLIKAQKVGTWKFHNNRGDVYLVPCTP